MLVCFLLVGAIMLPGSGRSSAQAAFPAGNSAEPPGSADQEGAPVKDFDAEEYYARLLRCAEQIRGRTDFVPDVALVLGSGLGNYTQQLDITETIPYADIGRHNAMDKVIGWACIQGIDLGPCLLFTTGRMPSDMVSKAINSGVSLLASKTYPSDLGIRLAKQARLTLITVRPNGEWIV